MSIVWTGLPVFTAMAAVIGVVIGGNWGGNWGRVIGG